MPNQRISQMDPLTDDLADDDLLVVVDSSDLTDSVDGTTKRMDAQQIIAKKIKTTTGPTVLSVGAIADGEFLKRSGTSVISAAAGGGTPGGTNLQVQYNNAGAFAGAGWDILAAGHLAPRDDNTLDIGEGADNRPRNINAANRVSVGRVDLSAAGDDKTINVTAQSGNQSTVFFETQKTRAAIYLPKTPGQLTADQNDYDPNGGSTAYFSRFVRLSSNASRTLTGLQFQTGTTLEGGIDVLLVNVGSNDIVLAHQSASSTAANRFLNSTGADITLTANQAADAIYDSTTQRWRVFKRN